MDLHGAMYTGVGISQMRATPVPAGPCLSPTDSLGTQGCEVRWHGKSWSCNCPWRRLEMAMLLPYCSESRRLAIIGWRQGCVRPNVVVLKLRAPPHPVVVAW